MARIYYDADADLTLLDSKRVLVVGYGSQGHAHALNLKDSGVDVVVGVRSSSPSAKRARNDGLQTGAPRDLASSADLIMMLAPDTAQPEIFAEEIASNLKKGAALAFAHGFNIHFNQIVAPEGIDVILIAPKGPGHLVRRQYESGGGVPALFAVAQDATKSARAIALAYAKGIGATRAGAIETTFQEETETDLFGEQAVLCGGVTELIRAGYDTLIEAGYQPEVAYFECLHEMKLIVDLIFEGGISNMRHSISDTAKYGDITRGRRVIDGRAREEMRKILAEIQQGYFAREWALENKASRPVYHSILKRDAMHGIEAVGDRLRSMMPWIGKKIDDAAS